MVSQRVGSNPRGAGSVGAQRSSSRELFATSPVGIEWQNDCSPTGRYASIVGPEGALVVLEELNDEALMEAYQQGDTRAFDRLLKKHRRPVFNFLRRQVGNEAMAEDLMQEVFLRIIKGAPSYKRQAKFTTWLYTIARNLCVDHTRRAKHRKVASLDQPVRSGGDDKGQSSTLGELVADSGPRVGRQVIGHQLQGHLQEAIAALGEEQREVFLMREFLNLPFKEIADIVGCPENTVKSRMRYALDHLRHQLEEYRDLALAVQ
jgi:RNA polymerase sigma-70 factor, ECF subfamily